MVELANRAKLTDLLVLYPRIRRIGESGLTGLACKAHDMAQRTDRPGERGAEHVWMYGCLDVWMSVWRCVHVSVIMY
jgi:hypothetical protein